MRAIVIIPASMKEQANKFCGELVKGGEDTFRAGLSPDGKGEPTHYICNWDMDDTVYQAVKKQFGTRFTEVPERNEIVAVRTADTRLKQRSLKPMQSEEAMPYQ